MKYKTGDIVYYFGKYFDNGLYTYRFKVNDSTIDYSGSASYIGNVRCSLISYRPIGGFNRIIQVDQSDIRPASVAEKVLF